MALAPRRRARRVVDYWRSERRTLRQGFVALLVSTLAALVAGVTLGSIIDTLEELPGLLILIPAVVAQRGVIFGAIGARLGTSTHAGLFEVTRNRRGILYQNAFVGVVSSLSLTLYVAALAKLVALAFGLPSTSFLRLVTISVVGGALASVVILALTIALAVTSYRREYDLDAVATPLITATADMITVPSLFLATILARTGWLNTAVGWACIGGGIFAAFRGLTTDLPLARRALLESIPIVLATPLLSILAGTVVESRLSHFLVLPGLLVLVPPFISNAGALGGILSSRLSSKLRLGLISPRGRPESLALLEASLVMAVALPAFSVVGALAWWFGELAQRAHPGLGTMVGGTLVAGLLATTLAIVIGYYIAIVTSRFGLDPDNHSIPIITSIMDLVGVVCLLTVLSLFGVSG